MTFEGVYGADVDRDNQDAAALRDYKDRDPSPVALPKVNQLVLNLIP